MNPIDLDKVFFIEARTGCTCCQSENHYRGPWPPAKPKPDGRMSRKRKGKCRCPKCGQRHYRHRSWGRITTDTPGFYGTAASSWWPGAAPPAQSKGGDGMSKRTAQCKHCDGGHVPIGEHFVTHDMATDAGDPSLEGQSAGIEWGKCQVCDGDGWVDEASWLCPACGECTCPQCGPCRCAADSKKEGESDG